MWDLARGGKNVHLQKNKKGQSAGDKREAAPPAERPAWMVDWARAALLDGRENLEVVGESRYQDNLWRLVDGQTDPTERVRVEIIAVLAAEPDNPFRLHVATHHHLAVRR